MEYEKRLRQEATNISKTGPLNITTNSIRETESKGSKLAKFLKGGDTIALVGELGSGKTTFTKGIARGLGVGACEYVNSPSFVIIKEYKGKLPLYHFDLYRIESLSEIEYLSPEEYLAGNGVVVIEWADKLSKLLPREYLEIKLDIVDNKRRRFSFYPHGKRFEALVSRYFKRKT